MRNQEAATTEDLQPRVAILWCGEEAVAAAVFRHSHETRPPTEAAAPRARQKRSSGRDGRQTEVLLFGVSAHCRRKRLGTAAGSKGPCSRLPMHRATMQRCTPPAARAPTMQ